MQNQKEMKKKQPIVMDTRKENNLKLKDHDKKSNELKDQEENFNKKELKEDLNTEIGVNSEVKKEII